MDFIKAHGTGNDFIVILDLEGLYEIPASLVQALCDRSAGVGADGLIRIAPEPGLDAFMDYRNADGSVVEMCGNGVRVVADQLRRHGIVSQVQDAINIGTRDGAKSVQVTEWNGATAYRVDMGIAEVGEQTTVSVDDFSAVGVKARTGNPHLVLRVPDPDLAPVGRVGSSMQRDDRFSEGVNVEFVSVIDRDHAALRVYERGVGETQACGTGACATVAALGDDVDDAVTVTLPGGDLRIERESTPDGVRVFLTGPAVEVARGALSADWLSAHSPLITGVDSE